jgi:hypothetical protein
MVIPSGNNGSNRLLWPSAVCLRNVAVAFVVCHALGLETGTGSSDYIQLYHGDSNLLWPAVVVELSNQYTLVISHQFQVVISSEVVTLKLHWFSPLRVHVIALFIARFSTLPSGGYNETA